MSINSEQNVNTCSIRNDKIIDANESNPNEIRITKPNDHHHTA